MKKMKMMYRPVLEEKIMEILKDTDLKKQWGTMMQPARVETKLQGVVAFMEGMKCQILPTRNWGPSGKRGTNEKKELSFHKKKKQEKELKKKLCQPSQMEMT